MEKMRLAVIGLGMIGKLHAETLRKIEGLEFVSVADVDERHRQTAKALGVPYYRSYEEMVVKEKIDGVVVAVPNDLHLPVGKTCAEKGLHLLVEKPIAGTLAEADALCAAAKKNGVHLMIGHHRRHNPYINALRETVRGGGIGKLIGVNAVWAILKPKDYFMGTFAWRTKKGAGPILINVIHEIDNLRYVCGDITRIYAEVSNGARKFEVADSIAVSLRLENDAMATIFFTDSAPEMWPTRQTQGKTSSSTTPRRPAIAILARKGRSTSPNCVRPSTLIRPRRDGSIPLTRQGSRSTGKTLTKDSSSILAG